MREREREERGKGGKREGGRKVEGVREYIHVMEEKDLLIGIRTRHLFTSYFLPLPPSLSLPLSYGPATQVRWLQDPKPADKAAAAVAKRPASSPAPGV